MPPTESPRAESPVCPHGVHATDAAGWLAFLVMFALWMLDAGCGR